GREPVLFPRETAVGALAAYTSDETVKDFQPMNINFGIIAPIEKRRFRGKREKNLAISERSLKIIDAMADSDIRR
ncbi:MAG: methylenetetrahydrofolate--tRNA-(uracil(54)-C(5))-methyltransferase (FADH(2)-oxidizing) TrmFO, partial [Bacillota bacterium]|nr:methylenetetrahydrofolate--tRNA-(uracil(54)-C(5))-methyltransferase (FADH(2)-oxidizing) TrmFO [Bacillota bacterium]